MDPPAWVVEELRKPRDYTADLKKLLASANICDKRCVFEQYDSMVQSNTVQGPGGEAGVMRIKGTGDGKPERGLAMALAGNGRWCWLDPKLGAMHAVAEAARKVACTGATPVAATNCLNFGNPEKPEIMAQFSATIDGIAEACTALGTPITGGNVSFYNETKGEGIYPTPGVGVVGILEDVSKAVPSGFQREGDVVIGMSSGLLISKESSDVPLSAFGSTEFANHLLGLTWGTPNPYLDLAEEAKLNRLLAQLASQNLLRSARRVSDGGTAAALAEAAISSGIGCDIRLSGDPETALPRHVHAFFAEPAGLVIATCAPEDQSTLIAMAEEAGVHSFYMGKVGGDRVVVKDLTASISVGIDELRTAFSSTLEAQLAAEVVTA
jgi:phosphoribosylformylglycinamidine synthase